MSDNAGIRTFTAGEALAVSRRVKIKSGTTTVPPEVVYADAGEAHIGTTQQAKGLGDLVAVRLANVAGTVEMVAAEAFAVGALLYGAADGKVADTAAGAALGLAIEAATADGDIVECIPAPPLADLEARIATLEA